MFNKKNYFKSFSLLLGQTSYEAVWVPERMDVSWEGKTPLLLPGYEPRISQPAVLSLCRLRNPGSSA